MKSGKIYFVYVHIKLVFSSQYISTMFARRSRRLEFRSMNKTNQAVDKYAFQSQHAIPSADEHYSSIQEHPPIPLPSRYSVSMKLSRKERIA